MATNIFHEVANFVFGLDGTLGQFSVFCIHEVGRATSHIRVKVDDFYRGCYIIDRSSVNSKLFYKAIDCMKTKQLLFCLFPSLFFATSCQKEVVAPPKSNHSPQLAGSVNQAQRKSTNDNLQILALGFTDLIVDGDFIDVLYSTLPCDGWLPLDEFGEQFKQASGGRDLYDEMNDAIGKYLNDDSNFDYVSDAIKGLVIDGIQYVPDITIPYFEETDLSIPPIVAAAVDDSEDRLTGYLIAERDVPYSYDPSTNTLVGGSSADVSSTYSAPKIANFDATDDDLRGQPITVQEAMLRPLIVIAPGDNANRENEDPCFGTGGGGSGGGGSTGGGGTSGCTVDADEDCMFKVGPVNTPTCSNPCNPAYTANGGFCLSTLSLVEGKLDENYNTNNGAKIRVRYLISKMNPDKTNDHLGVGGTSHRDRRVFLENREYLAMTATQAYSNHIILNNICQKSLTNNALTPGFDLNPYGSISSNSTYWYLHRYWITIYEDDWWVANKKEIQPPGYSYLDDVDSHQIRAHAATDLYYNGIIVLDNYGCLNGGCDVFYLDDTNPGYFKCRVGI